MPSYDGTPGRTGDMDGSRIALVVANDQYDDPGLKRLVAPAQDATALAGVLADPAVGGFEVQVLQNAPAQDIRFAVEDFFADRNPEDLLLLHFSCHGLKNSAGELFLAVADTKPARLASTAVAADFVNRQMADSRAQRIALFLDCCYGGAFPRGMVVRAAGEAQVQDAFAKQAEVGGGRGRVVITASSAMEYAFEGGQLASDASKPAPSVFTGAVVDGLTTGEADRDGDGWVGLTELVGFVTDRIHRVTPNQNPQMWTFGSQGELLIARSRVRRITPASLAPELTQAMESPLPAARFGVVDYLRERLYDADLGQAYAAWQALHQMTDDDSRKVSEAASEALSTAELRVTPESVELTGAMSADLRLSGPPVALTAAASPGDPWLKLEQEGEVIRVRAEQSAPGVHDSSVILAGPVGERVVPVRLTIPDTESEPPTPPPEPEPDPTPTPVPEPPRAKPTQAASPQPAWPQPARPQAARPEPAAARAERPTPQPVAASLPGESALPPWWLIAVLIAGSAVLVYLNWPGAAYSRKLWYDSNQGWYLYRTWYDPAIWGAFIALFAALVARWAGPIALGVVVGCAVSAIEGAALIVGGGISADETAAWVLSALIAIVMSVVLAIVLKPEVRRLWPVWPPAAALVVAGGILLVVSAVVPHSDGISFFKITPLALLDPIVALALAWPALAAVEARTKTWLTAAVVTYSVISAIGGIPALTQGHSPADFLTGLFGNLLIVIGVLLSRGRPLPSHP
ncbi:caspase family protein [Kribbella jiaozuonensis]|uniref:Caspase-related protein n=1 Tax=Kribbella jiaozuonensis TaxID=2575441 RepID=A0A4U3LGV6_9ACTN|nr:caspase family protein [Kribbella jiaozuonensis]TKK73287.1 caspase-related protein [Kribbella jiaozuonensis]